MVTRAFAAMSKFDIIIGSDAELRQALDDLRAALGNDNDRLLDHVLEINVLDDDELFHLFQSIASYIADSANNGSLADSARIQLTGTCEFALEALSSASHSPPKEPEEKEPEIVNIKEAEFEALKEVVVALVSDVRFILKHVVRRESQPSAPIRAKRLDALARKAGIRDPREGG